MCNHDAWNSEDQDKKGQGSLYKRITINNTGRLVQYCRNTGDQCNSGKWNYPIFVSEETEQLSGLPKAMAEFMHRPVHTIHEEFCNMLPMAVYNSLLLMGKFCLT